MVTIGQRLNKIRSEMGVSQKKMADFLGVSLNTYQRYEHDETVPAADLCAALCTKRNVRIEWLIMGLGGMRDGDVPAFPTIPDKPDIPVDGALLVNQIMMKSAIVGTLIVMERNNNIFFHPDAPPLKIIADEMMHAYLTMVGTTPPEKRPKEEISIDAIEALRKIPLNNSND